jgi:hypothetical protein
MTVTFSLQPLCSLEKNPHYEWNIGRQQWMRRTRKVTGGVLLNGEREREKKTLPMVGLELCHSGP